ncbi:MAG: PTS sugar transporter subunit IIA [Desulfococcaceae bacterium]|jgi:PTS system nitrogen regulatory IIA component|nr:PTS sugar transporter subunit IIA [Desulfococcaceae bacterium]
MKLTINEVAQSLDLPPSTLTRWIRQGRIPIQKSGDSFVFKKDVLEKWAENHNLLFKAPEKNLPPAAPEPENLLPVMQRGGIFYGLAGEDAESILKAATARMDFLSDENRSELYEHLLAREQLTSTGIGKGIAIPHPRTPLPEIIANPMIVTCFPENPLDFHAVDKKAVFILFILLSPNPKCHLHMLSRLSFCVRDDAFVRFLQTKPAAKEIYAGISDFETRLDQDKQGGGL